MSSGVPLRHEPSSRTWWSLSSKRHSSPNGLKADKDLRRSTEKPKPIPKFSTLTSALGIKTKKHPSFSIPEPLSPNPPPLKLIARSPLNDATISARPQTRPSAKSVSSSLPPKGGPMQLHAPPEPHKDPLTNRISLLTLSDLDPFAARGVSFAHSAQEHDQPSVHTGTPAPEISHKTNSSPSFLRRSSCASTSSQSHSHGGGISRNNSVAQSGLVGSETRSSQKKSKGDSEYLTGKLTVPPHSPLGSSRQSVIKLDEDVSDICHEGFSKSMSSATLPEGGRVRESDAAGLAPRARRITSSGTVPALPKRAQLPPTSTTPPRPSPSPSVSRQTSLSSLRKSSIRPRVIIRQASIKELGPAPRAPPSHELPPPPGDVAPTRAITPPSNSSSTLSFASVMSDARVEDDDISNRKRIRAKGLSRERDAPPSQKTHAHLVRTTVDDRHGKSPASVSFASHVSHRSVMKATSHYSHAKAAYSGPVPTSPTLPPANERDKPLRKHHSFHNTNQPAYPVSVPLRHASSFSPPSTSHSPPQLPDDSQLLEQHRGNSSGLPLPTRKRLFSGSSLRRPSTAQSRTEDALSVFSLPLDPGRELPHNRLFSNALSASDTTSSLHSSSFWEEQPTPTTSDHTPSSPVVSSPSEYIPQQIMSPAEMLKIEASVMADMDRGDSQIFGRSRRYSLTSTSTSASDGGFSLPSREAFSMSPRSTAERGLLNKTTQLGGKPQRCSSIIDHALNRDSGRTVRPVTADSQESLDIRPRSSSGSKPFSLPLIGLPPPPRPRPSPPVTLPDDSFIPLKSPPIRSKNLHGKTSGETMKQRRSILKKPSFLEIEDEPEKSSASRVESSFLDLDSGKESIDICRSVESEEPS